MKHIGRLALFLCLAVNAFFIGMLLLTAYSPYINPEVHPVQSCLGLTFPIFLVINFCFLIFWLIVRYRFALVPYWDSSFAIRSCAPICLSTWERLDNRKTASNSFRTTSCPLGT